MTEKSDFCALAELAVKSETLKKLVFSRPTDTGAAKVSARLCSHRGRRILALEYSLPSNTVSQRNVAEENIAGEISALIDGYRQANLITTLGDAELKLSKSGKYVLLGADALRRKHSGERPAFESAVEALDRKKNYFFTGEEDFLITLGISDKSGRVHDKKQGKFRQINRFTEHIEDIYGLLAGDGTLTVYDLCSGKSYLSFAVYHYLTAIKHRDVKMLCIDLKRDVIEWCRRTADALGYTGMNFVCDDIANTPQDTAPDLVISLHACDIATDIVLDCATELRAKVILSTPCCHRYMNGKIKAAGLSFITDYPQLSNKLCEAATDAVRLARMRACGYKVTALELTDPENTPKNTLLRAVREDTVTERELAARRESYEKILEFLLEDGKDGYLAEINKVKK